MTMHDFNKHIEEELDEIARGLGFEPQGQPLESKVRFINEKVSVFGFHEQALEYIKGYVDLLQKRTRYPDMLRIGAWTYLMMDEFRRTHSIKVTSLVRRWAPVSFRFLSAAGQQTSPHQWLVDWSERFPSKKYPESVYKYLVRRGPDIDRLDVLIMGWWKDAALDLASVPIEGDTNLVPTQLRPKIRRWKPEAASVHYDGWNWLANNLSTIQGIWFGGTEPARLLESLNERRGSRRFGLSRASFVLHVLSRGIYPIYDGNTHRGLYRLTRGTSYEGRIRASKQQDSNWYLQTFQMIVGQLQAACDCDVRLLDKALFAYGARGTPNTARRERSARPVAYFSNTTESRHSARKAAMQVPIDLPHGGPGARFSIEDLVSHLKTVGRDYIIQGQVNCSLEKHPKPRSLDVWLRVNFTKDRADAKQATNKVIEQIVSTRLFRVETHLHCPDTGRLCKGIRLLPGPR